MLHYEEYIVYHHHYPQDQFYWIYCHILTENGLEPHLQEGKQATGHIQEDVYDGPAYSWFPLVVPVELRQIFQERYWDFEVAHHTYRPEIVTNVHHLQNLHMLLTTSVRRVQTIKKTHIAAR